MELINSGNVDFVASSDERGQIREERIDQADNSSEETFKEPGQEFGADFMLIGTISNIKDQVSGTSIIFYQVNLELVDMMTNRKAWIGEKKIKRRVKRSWLTF